MRLRTVALIAGLVAAPVALAHAPKVGAHGGPQVDAGLYHLELVTGETSLDAFLVGHDGNAVPTEGYKGTAILLLDGKPQRIPLTPAGDNRLTGTAPSPLSSEFKGTVQITLPNGGTVQGRFH